MSEEGKYRRIVELGRGGMAVVNLTAMRSSHGVTKLVVVKELQTNLAADPEYRAMFLDEARLAARLNHPNVVQTFEIVDHVGAKASDGLEGVCALVMEYLEGQPLNRIRARLKDDPRALGVYLSVLVDALTGLEYAHALADYQGKPLNIVHRDMSPHNVFVTYSGAVKVLDFGIAKANDASSAPTQIGTVKGKVAYMAPEQASGERTDGRADVFSCGVMLWEAAVGRRLWAGMNDAAIMYKLSTGAIPTPREVKPDVPEALDAICRRALAHDPAQRYRSAAHLRDDLEAFVVTMADRPSRRALGDIVSSLFTVERTEVRRVVEEQLGKVSTTSTDQFGAISLPSLPRLMPPPSDSTTGVTDKPSGSTRVTHETAASSPSTVVPRSRAGILIGAIGAGLALMIAVVAIALSRRAPDVIATTPSATQSPSATPDTVPTSTHVGRRVLAVDPPTARVTANGARLAASTHALDGDAPVLLHVEADGYAPADLRVTFENADPIVVRLVQLAPVTTKVTQQQQHLQAHPTATTKTTTKPTTSPTDVGY